MKLMKQDKYLQMIDFDEDKNIKSVTCTCKWGTIHIRAWETGEILCKHIREFIKDLKGGLIKENGGVDGLQEK